MRTLFSNARLVLKDRIINGSLVVEGSKIKELVANSSIEGTFDKVIDCKEMYISPGFVEMHTHGAGGFDFMDGTDEAFDTACLTHMKHGTTTILPTLLAASREEIMQTIDAFKSAKVRLVHKGPNLHGLHMEGPYLSLAQCGAIDPKYIRSPRPEEYEDFLTYGRGAIKRWTYAVENEGALQFGKRLCEEGILPSIGHSNAEYSQVLDAYEQGTTHVTHLYSAMSTITRKGGFRISGVLESAFCIEGMTVELIADGCHLPPEILNMVYRLKGVDKVVLISDSMRCAGQDVKESILGSLSNGQRVIIEDDVAKMPDRTAFAGSIALNDRLIRVMTKDADVPLYDAITMMSLTPARILGIGASKGSLEVNKDADIVCFDEDIRIQGVMVEGIGMFGNLT